MNTANKELILRLSFSFTALRERLTNTFPSIMVRYVSQRQKYPVCLKG